MSVKTWTEEQECELVRLYAEEGVKDAHFLALHFSKKYRSVVSKLVQLRIYEKAQPTNLKNYSVKALLRDLEVLLDLELDGINLNKKENLIKIVNKIEELVK